MHTRINIRNFDLCSFMDEHHDDFIVFVSANWFYATQTGSYSYQTRYEGNHTLTRSKSLEVVSSPNRSMLEAALAACRRIQIRNKTVFIISPSPLGFKKGEKSKDPNADLVNEIVGVCTEKQLKINSVAIEGGGQLIKDILANKL